LTTRSEALQKTAEELLLATSAWRNSHPCVLSIYGPGSREDEVYVQRVPTEAAAGTAVDEVLRELGFHVERVTPDVTNLAERISSADFVFINAHGDMGECGRIQGLCDIMRTPYTGSGLLGSAVCLQKDFLSTFARGLGFSVPAQLLLQSSSIEDDMPLIKRMLPAVLKPARGGSSVGLRVIKDIHDFASIQEERQSWPAVLEEYIVGQDVTLGMIQYGTRLELLPPLIIDTASSLYGEDEKMSGHWRGEVRYATTEVPSSDWLGGIRIKVRSLVEKINLRGAIRFDFRISSKGEPFLLEVNTNPGISREGNLSLAARAAGLGFHRLIAMLALLASYDDPYTGKVISLTSLLGLNKDRLSD